jgi:magnesium-transporting ATPase (P-type)
MPANPVLVKPAQEDWHALSPEEAARVCVTSLDEGLDGSEARARLETEGPNRLPEGRRRPAWLRLLLQFHNPLIHVLIVAGAVAFLLGGHVDAVVIFVVVMINAVIGYVQEGKAERALDAVRDLLASRATVIRNGERHQIDASTLVRGDLVILESGDKVPADLRLVRARNLRVVEASLTGESAPVEKSTGAMAADAHLGDRVNMCFSGTLVSYGHGTGLVVATGTQTQIGRIGELVGEVRSLATPLTRRLDRFARQITAFILVVSLLTFLYGHFVSQLPMLEIFLAVVGLAVAAIPEGLPAVVTIVLAIGTRTMARNRAIVRRLPAVETLGSVSVICSDKTGTLTRNEMTVVRLVLSERELTVSGAGYAPEGGFECDGLPADVTDDTEVQALVQCAMLCNDARLLDEGDGRWSMVGDPTEGALVTLGCKAGQRPTVLQQQWRRVDALPFESERQYMATLNQNAEGQRRLFLKGAPERVLSLCRTQSDGLTLERSHWETSVTRAAEAGERVLALAVSDWNDDRREVDVDDITGRFELLGLVGIIDPPREEAIEAVDQCRHAGIRVKMITGDHAVTAVAIGSKLGLDGRSALTGDAIGKLDDDALRDQAETTDVFARATPEHKLRLISALQSRGHLVAMTGDGVNDAPALKAADIGVAMGQKGTDAAREASDLVLTDDNFATIARAVREGRVVYDNIKKSLMFMLPTNGGEAGVILLAVFAGLPLPVTAAQILWVNTVTAVTLALSLAFEPAERGVMSMAPRPPNENLITRALAARILFVTILIVTATFGIFQWELHRGSSLETARTTAVNMIAFCELVYLFNVRHFTAQALRAETLLGNRMALMVAALLLILQMLFTYAAPLQQVFRSEPLDLQSWAAIMLLACVVFLCVEVEKSLLRRAGVHRL